MRRSCGARATYRRLAALPHEQFACSRFCRNVCKICADLTDARTPARASLSGPVHLVVCAQEIGLADVHAVVPQDGVGRGHVEIEIRIDRVEQVGQTLPAAEAGARLDLDGL